MTDACPTCPVCRLLVDSLDRRIDQRFIDLEVRTTTHDELLAKAIEKAENTMNSRLEGMNEFRASLRDQAATFVPRALYDVLLDRVTKLERWPWLFAGAVALFEILSRIWK